MKRWHGNRYITPAQAGVPYFSHRSHGANQMLCWQLLGIPAFVGMTW